MRDADTKTDHPAPAAGQVWERRDGSRFTVERVSDKFATYWLESGSKPQYRTIALENFKIMRFRRVK